MAETQVPTRGPPGTDCPPPSAPPIGGHRGAVLGFSQFDQSWPFYQNQTALGPLTHGPQLSWMPSLPGGPQRGSVGPLSAPNPPGAWPASRGAPACWWGPRQRLQQ